MRGVLSGEVGGKSVAVFGCGPIGIFALQAATALEATEVFAVELAPARLKLAHQCVPSAVLINPRQVNPVEAIMEASGGQGVDVCLEYSGSGQALKQALKAVKCRGKVILIGVPSGPVELDVHPDIILKEANVLGISGRLIWQSWRQVRELLTQVGLTR